MSDETPRIDISAVVPTERPEERDSLAAVVKRFDATPKTLRNGQVYKDLCTLINEVRERETERAMWERASRNATSRILDLEAEVKELREENARLERNALQNFDHAHGLELRVEQMEEALRGGHKAVMWFGQYAGEDEWLEKAQPVLAQIANALSSTEAATGTTQEMLVKANETIVRDVTIDLDTGKEVASTPWRVALSPSDTEEKA